MNYEANGTSTTSNQLGMRVMQDRAYQRRGEQYLLIKSPPASGKSRALMFIALDKMHNRCQLSLHKIGVTTTDVKKRLANAKNDPTFLMDAFE